MDIEIVISAILPRLNTGKPGVAVRRANQEKVVASGL